MNRFAMWILAGSCLALASGCAANSAGPAYAPVDLPPNIADNARAIELGQTADAARYLAERASAQATDAARQQQQIEGKLTAVAQSTRDALHVRATTVAQDATATSVVADAEATQVARAGMQTATARADAQHVAATAQAALATDVRLRAEFTATREAAQQTRAAVTATAVQLLAYAQATATRGAQIAAVEEAESRAQRDNAGTREILVNLFWFVLIVAVLALTLLCAFLLMRFWMAYEQKMRIVEKGNHLFVIESGNGWGGAPTYKWIDGPPPVPQIAAPTALPNDAAASLSIDIPPAALASKRLNLAEQPHGLSIPLGATAQGDKWLPLARAGHILIGGPTGSGKTLFVHAIVQALLHRGMADMVLHDGKRGLEFARYATEPRVRVVEPGELERALADALGDMAQRYEKMLERGVRDIERYNVAVDEPMRRTVIVLDELKEIDEQARGQVLSLMRMGRAAGIHLILATQFPDARTVPTDIRGNATTRIAFAVANHHESAAILGSAGAESLPRVPGRALLECFGERVEVQTFTVDLPDAPVVTVAPSPFSDVEKKMIQLALDEGGWFKVKKTARELKMSDAAVTATAEAWERRGWLSPEQSNVGRPGKNGRALLPPLADLAKKHGIAMSPKAHHVAHVPHVLMSPKAPPA